MKDVKVNYYAQSVNQCVWNTYNVDQIWQCNAGLKYQQKNEKSLKKWMKKLYEIWLIKLFPTQKVKDVSYSMNISPNWSP